METLKISIQVDASAIDAAQAKAEALMSLLQKAGAAMRELSTIGAEKPLATFDVSEMPTTPQLILPTKNVLAVAEQVQQWISDVRGGVSMYTAVPSPAHLIPLLESIVDG